VLFSARRIKHHAITDYKLTIFCEDQTATIQAYRSKKITQHNKTKRTISPVSKIQIHSSIPQQMSAVLFKKFISSN
jgi:hypothetical protein